MHLKFLARGTGSARVAADYLLGARDATGQLRAGVEVLRGDPQQVAAVADALPFEHKYTSGVIAWAPEDAPTAAQIGAVLDEFEQTTWAGLDTDHYAWTAVQHREGAGVHVHVLAARCDLATGKSLNIAPPGWQKTFDALRDWQNHEHGWSRPDDPARARLQQPGHRAPIDASRLRAGLEVEPDPRTAIRDYLIARIEDGAVRDRAGVVTALQEAGLEVPRAGQDYLTARDPASSARWRLKGELYGRDFQRERLNRAAPAADRAGPATHRGAGAAAAHRAFRELASHREARAVYNRAQYAQLGHAVELGRANRVVAPGRRRPVDLARHLRRELGLTRWLPSGIQTRIETRTALTRQIAQYQEQRDRLRAETWGVLFHEDAGGRFLVLPEGTVLDTLPYTLGDRRAVKLLSE